MRDIGFDGVGRPKGEGGLLGPISAEISKIILEVRREAREDAFRACASIYERIDNGNLVHGTDDFIKALKLTLKNEAK